MLFEILKFRVFFRVNKSLTLVRCWMIHMLIAKGVIFCFFRSQFGKLFAIWVDMVDMAEYFFTLRFRGLKISQSSKNR